MAKTRKFSKALWLQSANKQKEDKLLSDKEINDALEIWVNDCDGKTYEELAASGAVLNDAWFVTD